MSRLSKLRSKLKSSSVKAQSSFDENDVNRDSKGQFASKNSSKLDVVKKVVENEVAAVQRLTAQNRSVNHDRESVSRQTKQWTEQYGKIQETVQLQELKISNKKLSTDIEQARNRLHSVVDVGNSLVPESAFTENKKYHAQNLQINSQQEGNAISYRLSYTGKRLGYIQKEGEYYAVHNKTISGSKPNLFKSMNSADEFLRSTATAYIERNIFPIEKAQDIEQYGRDKIKQLSKSVRNSGYNKAKLNDLTDNQNIGEIIIEDGKRKNARLIGIQDKSGNLQVAAKYSRQSDHIHVDYLATAPWNFSDNDVRRVKGAGAAAIAELVKLSMDSGKKGKIKLTALDGAVPFYKHLGFKATNGISEYSLSSKDAQKLLEKYG